ncbi:MAG: SLBB domain-containing protein, partial [Candidatus Rokubacteria bacterium]|nr:SLBB domain-containing protein [Candidatus Rokubacteria bacterium]
MRVTPPRVNFIYKRALCWTLVGILGLPTGLWAQVPSPSAPAVPTPTPAVGSAPGQARFALSPDYRLGPGDTVEVIIAGRVDVARHVLVVTPEGNLHLPPMGTIPVAGLTVAEARKAVVERTAPLFKFFDLTLTVITARAFEVTVSGEVERPGTYAVTATDRLQQVIAAAGGITPRGSLRKITVVRQGKVDRTVDLLRFALRGDMSQNPYMSEGVGLFVPPKGPSVTLLGSVVRPGEYEIGEERTLGGLLALTGGLSSQAALSEARLTRIGPDSKKETRALDLARALSAEAPEIELRAGDVLFVPPISVLQDVVEVRGALLGTGADPGKTTTVGKPTLVARIELASGDRVKDVVVKAGGVAPYANFRRAFVERGGVSGPRQTIPVDLHRLLVEKDESQNLALQNGDVFVVPVAEDRVYVIGNVRAPGSFDYRPFYSPKDYVMLAGGPDRRAKMGAATVTFPDGKIYKAAAAPPLEPGAVVQVPVVVLMWYEDLLLIASAVACIVTAYTGLY